MGAENVSKQIAEYFKTQPVLKAWLFGSFARGEQTEESDVDILFEPDMSQRFSLFTLGEIDLVPVGSLVSYAQQSANQDKVLIYEREN